jgi:hypothetical protein
LRLVELGGGAGQLGGGRFFPLLPEQLEEQIELRIGELLALAPVELARALAEGIAELIDMMLHDLVDQPHHAGDHRVGAIFRDHPAHPGREMAQRRRRFRRRSRRRLLLLPHGVFYT